MLQTTIQHLREALANVAPQLAALSLNKGAADAEIESFEQSANKKLPGDLKQLYKEINGNVQEENFGNFFYGLTFYSLEEALTEWNFRKRFSEEGNALSLAHHDKQIDGSNLYNTDWIPIATDGSRDVVCVDLAPTGSGTYGQIIYLDGTYNTGIVVANSTTQLLQQFITDLNNGQYYLAIDALDDGHHWLETKDEIDLGSKVRQTRSATLL